MNQSPDKTLERYLADIRRSTRLDAPEEERLLRLARAGSLEARDKLVLAHMRFVVTVALHYRNGPLPVPDLISEGAMGLIRAIESYEGDRGIKFISYAVWWIRSYIVRAIESKGSVIRLPANEHARIRREKKRRTRGPAAGEDGRPWVRAESVRDRPGSEYLEEGVDPTPLADAMLEAKSLEGQIDGLLSGLPPQEAFVIRNLFGIRQEEVGTLQEVGWDLGLSAERVRQMRNNALRRMKEQV